MRLFFAINFNNETRTRLLELRDELRRQSERGRFSLPENLHLTLAFLGECDAGQIAAAKSAHGMVGFEPFDIAIDRIGRFKRGNRDVRPGGDLWWSGLRECIPLIALLRDLAEKLTALGFSLDDRKFSPHITLGREVVTDVKPWTIEPFGETVSKIDLMKSERIGGRMVYTAISFPQGHI